MHYGGDSAAGSTIAIRSNETGTEKLSFLTADRHGTASIAVTADSTQALTKRYTTPFGSARGTTTGTWPDDKSFLGKTADTGTGLTHIGAREYDPSLGQFISVDPILAPDQPQSLNGYSYAANSPVTNSDPTGLKVFEGDVAGTGGVDSGGGSNKPAEHREQIAIDNKGCKTLGECGGGGPLPSPSPGPPPTPGPYPKTKAGGLFSFLWGLGRNLAYTVDYFALWDSDCRSGGGG
ncbi:RHS repeat-associated core domain-containing protein [Streptomyces sp. 2131.1]|uniref:RHS repeat-associated core domain-containing protein n=1 Tax=Streptomyces sp. 2131.1 TaxID=1855346 RepID=UPI000AF1BB20